ncbi:MAG: FAD-binding oxidoreductase [Bdellovibrionales bacterium]|nr:FAD-binding oxidoreductase [Bdellovibrionales bacterium]
MNLKELKFHLTPDQVVTDSDLLTLYGQDWLKQWNGKAGAVVFPKSTEDVVHIVNWAKSHKISLIPSGGRTGLSGGATALKGELVVSFDKMNHLSDFNPVEQTVLVEPGVVTQTLQEFALERDCFFPVSFAAEGSSQIGGNIATNAGGVHVIRYGTMRQSVLGLEVVTGEGKVLNLGRGLIKNATGYNLMNLFIGSEGTLGFITKALIKLLSPPPKDPLVFLFSVENKSHIPKLYQHFKTQIAPMAFEMFTDKALNHVMESSDAVFPLENRSPFYILMEIEESDKEKAFDLFEKALNDNLLQDGTLSQNQTQARELWKFRENITESLSEHQPYKNDICVRTSVMVEFLDEVEECLKKQYPEFEVIWFGHIGDGNLHINILKPKNLEKDSFLKQCEKASAILFSLVKKYQGTISAEHGIGLLKKPYLNYTRSEEEIELMKKIKRVFDPDGILNPGKIFDL